MTMFKPHPYQEYAIRRIVEEPAVGLLLDMGLGKTVITLTALNELMYDRFEVRKALVIAPKKVAEATWQAEAAKWEHLRELRFATVLGTEKQRLAALEAEADVYVVNRENVVWLVETAGKRPRSPSAPAPSGREPFGWPFDMVIVDESSSFKSPSAKRFRALRRVLPRVKKVVILTGTPAPNGIGDLWAQVYLLDRGERLGKFVSHYRERYFDYNPWRHEYAPKPGAFEAVQARIADICVSMRASDWLQLPERIVRDVPVLLEGAALAAYRKLEKEMLLEVRDTSSGVSGARNGDTSSDRLRRPPSRLPQSRCACQLPWGGSLDGEGFGEVEITALSAAALTGKLLQLCGGCVYDETGTAHTVHTAKLEALGELLEALNGEPALIFYGFRHELPGITRALEQSGRTFRVLSGADDVTAWSAGKLDALVAHPASCGYGLNLQEGGRHVVWYTLPWALELYQQANARLYRQGQDKPVVIHRLLAKVEGGTTADDDVAEALEGKADVQAALIEALRARIEGVRRQE